MKSQLRKIARGMANWPLIGRLVRIGAALFRLPELCVQTFDLTHRVYALTNTVLELNHLARVSLPSKLASLTQGVQALNPGERALQTEQLPLPKYPRKLNVGCGYDKRSDYLNVDVDPACNPDLLIVNGDYSDIPRGYFSEVLAKDVLEHIPRSATLPVLLDFADYLVTDGRLIVETTSILHVAAKFQQSQKYAEHECWTICLFGNQAHPGDFHYLGFTEITLRVYLLAAGFEIALQEMHHDWMFYVEAKKTSDWAVLLTQPSLSNEDFLEAAYRQAFFRGCDAASLVSQSQLLRQGADRKDVLKSIFSAPERLFRIAERNGF